jgi:hypothetical protein
MPRGGKREGAGRKAGSVLTYDQKMWIGAACCAHYGSLEPEERRKQLRTMMRPSVADYQDWEREYRETARRQGFEVSAEEGGQPENLLSILEAKWAKLRKLSPTSDEYQEAIDDVRFERNLLPRGRRFAPFRAPSGARAQVIDAVARRRQSNSAGK